MSKVIKQMEMDALKTRLRGRPRRGGAEHQGADCQAITTFRANLRKKNIRVKVVKNSLTRKVFGELGLNVGAESPYWVGPTTLVFGAGSVAELSQAVDGELKTPKTAPLYKDKVKIKGAVADGQEVPLRDGPQDADALAGDRRRTGGAAQPGRVDRSAASSAPAVRSPDRFRRSARKRRPWRPPPTKASGGRQPPDSASSQRRYEVIRGLTPPARRLDKLLRTPLLRFKQLCITKG